MLGCPVGQPSLEMQWGQKISLLIMRRSKRRVSHFPCSDEYKRTVSCAEVKSLVIEDWKSPYDLISYIFEQFSGFSPNNRSMHVGWKTKFSATLQLGAFLRRIGGWDDIELLRRIGEYFTFLTCYLFSTCEFLFFTTLISVRHLTYKLLKLNRVCVI